MSAKMEQETNSTPELDQLCINTIRTLTIDAVQKAKSGHPGLPLGAAPMAYVLWTKFMRHNPRNPKWENRDRFLLVRRPWLHVALLAALFDRLRSFAG